MRPPLFIPHCFRPLGSPSLKAKVRGHQRRTVTAHFRNGPHKAATSPQKGGRCTDATPSWKRGHRAAQGATAGECAPHHKKSRAAARLFMEHRLLVCSVLCAGHGRLGPLVLRLAFDDPVRQVLAFAQFPGQCVHLTAASDAVQLHRCLEQAPDIIQGLEAAGVYRQVFSSIT